MSKALHILGHLDLGDCWILNGLIRTFAEMEDEIVWYVAPKYVEDVQSSIADLPNVKVAPAGGGYEDPAAKWLDPALRSLRLGFFNAGKFDLPRWDSEFYRQAELPFEFRWSKFRLSPAFAWPPRHPDASNHFSLVHEDPARGFVIDDARLPGAEEIIRIVPGVKPALHWLPEIFYADEVHVINSSFLNLVESLTHVPARLVFHRYARPWVEAGPNCPTLLKPWVVLD